MVIREFNGLAHTDGTSADSFVVDSPSIVHTKGYILNTVAVFRVMLSKFLVVWVEGGAEREDDISISNDVSAELAFSSFETLNVSQNRSN